MFVVISMGLLLQNNVLGMQIDTANEEVRGFAFILSSEYIQELTSFGANGKKPSITLWDNNNHVDMMEFDIALQETSAIAFSKDFIPVAGAINLPLYEDKFCPANSFMFDAHALKEGTLYAVDVRITHEARQECAYCYLIPLNNASARAVILGPKILNSKCVHIKKEPVR
jgi:hypothetical protein